MVTIKNDIMNQLKMFSLPFRHHVDFYDYAPLITLLFLILRMESFIRQINGWVDQNFNYLGDFDNKLKKK